MKRLHLLFTSYFLRSAFFELVSVMGPPLSRIVKKRLAVTGGAGIVADARFGVAIPSFSRGPEERDIAAIPVATVFWCEVQPDHRLFTSS